MEESMQDCCLWIHGIVVPIDQDRLKTGCAMRESKGRLELLRTAGTYICFSVSSLEDVGDLQGSSCLCQSHKYPDHDLGGLETHTNKVGWQVLTTPAGCCGTWCLYRLLIIKIAVAPLLPFKSHLEPYREGDSRKLGFIAAELTSYKATTHSIYFQKCF